MTQAKLSDSELDTLIAEKMGWRLGLGGECMRLLGVKVPNGNAATTDEAVLACAGEERKVDGPHGGD